MTILLIAKATFLFAAALVVTAFAKRAAAETRHCVLTGAQLAALVLPLLGAIVPPLAVIPAPVTRTLTLADAPAPDVGPGAPAATAAPARRTTRDVLSLIWLAGVVVAGSTKLVALGRAVAIVRRGSRAGDVVFTDEIGQPSTIGRSILLPRAAASWSPQRLRAVVLHEQAHVARHDTLLALIGDAACAVYWFHPLAWLVARSARLERERACDDRVLAAGVAPADYATAMLEVAQTMQPGTAAAMPMAERSQLEHRIRAILDPAPRRRSGRAASVAALAAILAATPLLAALTPFGGVPRPRGTEPDLLGDAVASPFSERVEPPVRPRLVQASGPDAALIAYLTGAASRPPQHSIDFVPERARWALAQVREGELVVPLIESLHEPDWRVRAYAAWALGKSADRRATAALTPLLSEDIWRVRAMAAHALANLADINAREALVARIDDPAWQVRLQVVRYLGTLGGHRPTIEAMRTDRHIAVRDAAETALGRR